MSKIGPNQPCPCGSGKKYKKCCFLKGGVSPAPATEHLPPRRPRSYDEIAAGIPEASPYGVARDVQEQILASGRRSADCPVLMCEVAEMSTEELLRRLSALGISLAQEQLVSEARGKRSAWELSRPWRSSIPADHPRDHDFAALAICQLWQRWCPDPPSMEMVDDWMAEGYACLEDGETAAACEHWWKVWQVLRGWFTPDMRTFTAAERAFQGSQLMFNWLQDFAMYSADVAEESRPMAERARDFILECLERFSNEKCGLLNSMRRDLAKIYFALGEATKGRAILEKMIDSDPKSVAAYATLSDALYRGARTPAQVQEALDVLLRAKKARVRDGRDFDLDGRIRDLRDLKPLPSADRPKAERAG